MKEEHAEAVRWYRKAAEQGDSNSQHTLGCMHANGQGVKQDDAEAVRWFWKAAEQDAHTSGIPRGSGSCGPERKTQAAKDRVSRCVMPL